MTHTHKWQLSLAALTATLLVLVAYIFWSENNRLQPSSTNTTELTNISIEREGFDTIDITRIGESWSIVKPYKVGANATRIEPVKTLRSMLANGYAQNEVEMEFTGLQDSKASITIDETKIVLGNASVDGDRRYALANDQVHLLPEWVWSLIHGGVSAFAELTVFDALPSSLYLEFNGSVTEVNNTKSWQALVADKVTEWPVASATQASVLRLHKSQTIGSDTLVAEISKLPDFTAISRNNGYAYLISNDTLEALLNP